MSKEIIIIWKRKYFSHCSYIVVTIYCLGFIYSLPRFFEYKTEVQRVNFTNFENETEFIDYTVIENKLQKSPIYQYTVHLSKFLLIHSSSSDISLCSFVQSFSKHSSTIDVIIFQCWTHSKCQRQFTFSSTLYIYIRTSNTYRWWYQFHTLSRGRDHAFSHMSNWPVHLMSSACIHT